MSKLCRAGIAAILFLATLSLYAQLAAAQEDELQLPISVDADSLDYDEKRSMMMYRGLKLTQGSTGIQADIARASSLDFNDSVWHFDGNVIIDVRNGHIEAEAADLKFSDHQLQRATITGSPATFEMQRPDSDVVTHAEAGKLVYDFSEGVVEFSGDATITEGGNQISSEYLVYNITEQRIKASAGDGESKVKIMYTPDDSENSESDEDSSEENEGQEIEPENQ